MPKRLHTGMTEDEAHQTAAALDAGRVPEHCGRRMHNDNGQGYGWYCSNEQCPARVETSFHPSEAHGARTLWPR